jgi:hypothetical protein
MKPKVTPAKLTVAQPTLVASSDKNAPTSAPPTVEQLASLAASLTRSKMGDRLDPPGFLVSRAMGIWKAAHELLTGPQPLPIKTTTTPIPMAYPVILDKFLLLMLDKRSGRTGLKYSIFRDYLRYCLCHPDYDEASDTISHNKAVE